MDTDGASESSQMQLKWQDVKKSGLAWNCLLGANNVQMSCMIMPGPNSTIAAKVFAFTEIEVINRFDDYGVLG